MAVQRNHDASSLKSKKIVQLLYISDILLCPVALYRLYTSKLNPQVKYFWQRPKSGKRHYNDPVWYDRIRVGHEPLENFMAQLSMDANLSKRYTNHSIRSTVMNILGDEFSDRKVIAWSGHKSENTVKQYARKLPSKTKREMSTCLTGNLVPIAPAATTPKSVPSDETQQKQYNFKRFKPAETISKPPESNESVLQAQPLAVQDQNVPNMQFDLQAVQLNEEPVDDALINFLNQFDPITEQPPPAAAPATPTAPQGNENAVQVPVPVQNQMQSIANHTMNIQTVQNVNPNQKIPMLYFPNSNVTINYNFKNN